MASLWPVSALDILSYIEAEVWPGSLPLDILVNTGADR